MTAQQPSTTARLPATRRQRAARWLNEGGVLTEEAFWAAQRTMDSVRHDACASAIVTLDASVETLGDAALQPVLRVLGARLVHRVAADDLVGFAAPARFLIRMQTLSGHDDGDALRARFLQVLEDDVSVEGELFRLRGGCHVAHATRSRLGALVLQNSTPPATDRR